MHRIHTAQALEPEAEFALEGDAAHYLGRVLRVAPGQPLVLFNGDGCDYAAEVRAIDRRGVVVAISSRLPGLPESPLAVTIAQAVSRGERMDQTLQKCTELGAAAFQPLLSERVEVRLTGSRLDTRLQHWRAVVVAACEQCGRARVPPVLPPRALGDWLEAGGEEARLVLDPQAGECLAAVELAGKLQLAVGPEGGFSEAEQSLMRDHGVQGARLGPRILRTETAAPAALAVLQCLAGDLGPA